MAFLSELLRGGFPDRTDQCDPAEFGEDIDSDLPDLPAGIRSRFIDGVNGLRVHVLEAGFERADHPLVLLLHGFPELAYSWRKVMPDLAGAGYHVVAPDQRGYGRTTGWDGRYDGRVRSFGYLNLVRDVLELVQALGRTSVAAVVGHDFGSPLAAHCALARPDVFQGLVMMSAPFGGLPALRAPAPAVDIHAALAALDRPRKLYQWYYSTPQAHADMRNAPQGLRNFLRAYYHSKSADWPGNQPFALAGWNANELAKMPTYYVMDLSQDMPATVAPHMPTAEQIATCQWLPDRELAVYADEYARTGFQGGLQWYRCGTSGMNTADFAIFSGRTIDVPSLFIAGAADWGVYQSPGAFEAMQGKACTKLLGTHLVDGAGHWVQQEQPKIVSDLLLRFLRQIAS